MVLNLAANARDAMPRGRRADAALPALRRDGVRFAGLEVRDTGTGIPPEVLPHIFAPFFTTRSERGTGLGLATVQDIVSAAGGFVAAESTPGRGHLHAGRPAHRRGPGRGAARRRGGGRVLLVEDEPVARRLAERALTSWGWQVVAADSAEAALDLAARTRLLAGWRRWSPTWNCPGAAAPPCWPSCAPGPAGRRCRRSSSPAMPRRRCAAIRRVQALLAVAAPPTGLLSKPYPLPELRARWRRLRRAG